MAAASARTSIPTTCSCCRRTASGAGASAPQKDLSLVEGLPLKILNNFKPQEEFVLEPGDMLYLPPHYAHDGVAEGECMTYSIGFRSPSYQELGEAFLQFMADSIDLPGRYADPDLDAGEEPGRNPARTCCRPSPRK